MFDNILLLTVIIVLTFGPHEFAHAWVAFKLGDNSQLLKRRLTLNPLRHIDPLGTIVVPIVCLLIQSFFWPAMLLFGWAKPVEVDVYQLRASRKDFIKILLAGSLVNLVLAGLFYITYMMIPDSLPHQVGDIIKMGCAVNFCVGVFNLIPVPPLDGGKVLALLLPKKIGKAYLRTWPVCLTALIAGTWFITIKMQ